MTSRGFGGAPGFADSLEVTTTLANSLAVTTLVVSDVDRAKIEEVRALDNVKRILEG